MVGFHLEAKVDNAELSSWSPTMEKAVTLVAPSKHVSIVIVNSYIWYIWYMIYMIYDIWYILVYINNSASINISIFRPGAFCRLNISLKVSSKFNQTGIDTNMLIIFDWNLIFNIKYLIFSWNWYQYADNICSLCLNFNPSCQQKFHNGKVACLIGKKHL